MSLKSESNPTEQRRDALKIIGAIGTTCAFPFSANELYGQEAAQHDHPGMKPPPPVAPYTPKFFNAAEFKTVSQVAELIIPATDTPGAIGAGVPQYIDEVVGRSKELQTTFKAGLEWLGAKKFGEMNAQQQTALLLPVSEAVDQGQLKTPEQKFFKSVKSLTADGYYTSYAGLVTELGYQGNQALASFPSCELPAK